MYTIIDDDGNESMVAEPSPDYIYTYADYLQWNFEERLELFRGKIFKMSAPARDHQEISGNLFFSIRFCLGSNYCKVFSAPFGVRLPVKNKKKDNEINTVVQPDICVVCHETKLDSRAAAVHQILLLKFYHPAIQKRTHRINLNYTGNPACRNTGS